ncbi:MAG: hypothetical protein HC879_20445 [Leptolyngbyaceae cyanobacterium SL_5_9]|nr:hypothetical protein [Leptolyngbyaceae cyanobacterium SL_5_9]
MEPRADETFDYAEAIAKPAPESKHNNYRIQTCSNQIRTYICQIAMPDRKTIQFETQAFLVS